MWWVVSSHLEGSRTTVNSRRFLLKISVVVMVNGLICVSSWRGNSLHYLRDDLVLIELYDNWPFLDNHFKLAPIIISSLNIWLELEHFFNLRLFYLSLFGKNLLLAIYLLLLPLLYYIFYFGILNGGFSSKWGLLFIACSHNSPPIVTWLMSLYKRTVHDVRIAANRRYISIGIFRFTRPFVL